MTPRSKPNQELLARLDERQKALLEKLDAIHQEVKKTNGRVTTLEGWRNELKGTYRATALIASLIGAVATLVTRYLLA